MITLFGISNCTSVKKAKLWLENHHHEYVFVDFKKSPPTESQIANWLTKLDIKILINKKGTTWRTLDATQKELLQTPQQAISLIQKYPNLIKRPLIDWNGQKLTVGFDEAIFKSIIG